VFTSTRNGGRCIVLFVGQDRCVEPGVKPIDESVLFLNLDGRTTFEPGWTLTGP
jgi:hypothetical protein